MAAQFADTVGLLPLDDMSGGQRPPPPPPTPAPPVGTIPWRLLLWLLIGAIAIVGLIVGAIALAQDGKRGPPGPPGSSMPTPSPMPTASVTPSPLPAGCDIYGDTICADTIEVIDILAENITAESTCTPALMHTQSGMLSPHWSMQIMQGAGIPVPLPSPSYPVTEYPLNELGTGIALPDATSVQTTTGMKITADGISVSLIDVDGLVTFQLGQEDPFTNGANSGGLSPGNGQHSGVVFSPIVSSLSAGAFGIKFSYKMYVSSETDFDFFTASSELGTVQYSGFGNSTHPYLIFSGQAQAVIGSEASFIFSKDGLFRQGVDACRLQIFNLTAIPVPLPSPLGTEGITLSVPSNLSEYECKTIKLCAKDGYMHRLNLTGSGRSFDVSGQYTEMIFVNGGPCCVEINAPDSQRLAVDTSHTNCVHFCKAGGTACTTSLNKLSDKHAVLEITSNVVMPSSHTMILMKSPASLLSIPCNNIADYIGRQYIVTNNGGALRKIQIVSQNLPCNVHFQLGAVPNKRIRASSIVLDASKGAFVEFTVLNENLIVVTQDKHVRRCDDDGECSTVGFQISPFAGWWASASDLELADSDSNARVTLFYIDDSDYELGNDRITIHLFEGAPKYYHQSIRGTQTFNINDFPGTWTITATINGPYELCLGNPAPYVRCGKVDPTNTSFFYFQYLPTGPGAFPGLILNEFDFSYQFLNPSMVYRRISTPYGSSRSPSLGNLDGPSLMPVTIPQIYQRGDGFTDAKFMFDYFVQTVMNTYHQDMFNTKPGGKCDGVESWEYAMSLAQEILDGKVFITETNLVRAMKTNTARGITIVETEKYHTVTPFSNVTFSGITGEWSALNDKSLRVGYNTNRVKKHLDNTIDYGSDPAQRSLHFYFEIDFDSSNLVADNVTGFWPLDGKMTVQHGPLTSDMEYKPLMDIMTFWTYNVFVESTHNFLEFPSYGGEADTFRSCRFYAETWDQVQADLNNDPFGIHKLSVSGSADASRNFEQTVKQRVNNEDVSSLYVNAFSKVWVGLYTLIGTNRLQCALNSATRSYSGLENDPNGELLFGTNGEQDTYQQLVDSPLNQHIPLENYCDRSTWMIPYWRTEGAPGSNLLGIESSASVLYPPYDGTKGAYMVGEIYNVDELPCVNCNLMFSAPLNGPCNKVSACLNVSACNDGLCESYYEYLRDTNPLVWNWYTQHTAACILNRSFTDGHSIGYFHISDTTHADPQRYMMSKAMAIPGTDAISNPRRRREAMTGVFSPLYQYLFTNQSAEAIEYDIRGNTGGSFRMQMAASEYHGTERKKAFGNNLASKGGSQQSRLRFDDLYDPYDYMSLMMNNGTRYIYPEISEANYPGSTRPGANAWILSNWQSTSGGDLFLQAFAGDNNDGNLGGGAFSYVAGNPVGTLFGCSNTFGISTPMIPESTRLFSETDGLPIAPIRMGVDVSCATLYPDGTTPSCARSQHSIPIKLDAAPGKSGSNAPPHDIETLRWPDVGYVENTRPRLSGDTRPQTPTQQSEKRDWWLEALTMQVISDLEAKKRSPPADHTDYYARVEEHRRRFAADNAIQTTNQPTVRTCSEAESSAGPATVTIGQMVFSNDGQEPTFVVDGKPIDLVNLQAIFYGYHQAQVDSNTLCQRQDGSIISASAATPIPVLETIIQHAL